MPITRVIGIVLVVVGVALLYFGWQASESVGEQLMEGVTGRYTDETMWYLIGGAASIVGGIVLAVFGARR